MKNKNSKTILLLISFVLFFSLIALSFALKIYLDKTKPDIIEDDIIEEEVEIDENKEYKDLIDIINLIDTSYNNNITDIYEKELNITDINSNNKKYAILLRLLNDKIYDNISEEEYNTLYSEQYGSYEDNKEYFGVITKNKLEELYIETYNEEIDFNYEKINGYCPIFYYINDRYYFVNKCEKKLDGNVIYYIYNKIYGENSIDIYISLAAIEYNGTNYSVYDYDFYKHNIYKKVDSKIFFEINEKNYNDFSKYRLHFIKIKDKYYFDSVRAVE